MLRETTCVCGMQLVEVLGEKDGRTVGACLECGLVRTMQVADDYATLYTDGLRYHAERPGQPSYLERVAHDREVATLRIPRHLQATDVRILDVGCANGGFIAEAQALGIRSEGLEPNPIMAEQVRASTGALVHTDWSTVLGKFTLITYHDVLEHIEDPVAELAWAKQYLQPRGVLVVDTPDAADPRFAELGMAWHHMKPLEHLWFFTQETLQMTLGMAGLSAFKRETPIPGKVVMYAR